MWTEGSFHKIFWQLIVIIRIISIVCTSAGGNELSRSVWKLAYKHLSFSRFSCCFSWAINSEADPSSLSASVLITHSLTCGNGIARWRPHFKFVLAGVYIRAANWMKSSPYERLEPQRLLSACSCFNWNKLGLSEEEDSLNIRNVNKTTVPYEWLTLHVSFFINGMKSIKYHLWHYHPTRSNRVIA